MNRYTSMKPYNLIVWDENEESEQSYLKSKIYKA